MNTSGLVKPSFPVPSDRATQGRRKASGNSSSGFALPVVLQTTIRYFLYNYHENLVIPSSACKYLHCRYAICPTYLYCYKMYPRKCDADNRYLIMLYSFIAFEAVQCRHRVHSFSSDQRGVILVTGWGDAAHHSLVVRDRLASLAVLITLSGQGVRSKPLLHCLFEIKSILSN